MRGVGLVLILKLNLFGCPFFFGTQAGYLIVYAAENFVYPFGLFADDPHGAVKRSAGKLVVGQYIVFVNSLHGITEYCGNLGFEGLG